MTLDRFASTPGRFCHAAPPSEDDSGFCLASTAVLVLDRPSYGQYNTVDNPTSGQGFLPDEPIRVSGTINLAGAPNTSYVVAILYDSSNTKYGQIQLTIDAVTGAYDSNNGTETLNAYPASFGEMDHGYVVVKAYDASNNVIVGTTKQVGIIVEGE